MSRPLVEMSRCSEEMDVAIAKLQQNFQELRNNLEKAFLEQGRALLRFEAQWKDLKTGHTRELEQRGLQLQQRGILVPLTGTQHFPPANQNPTLWSNSTTPRWSDTNTPLPPRDSTTKLFCDICKIFCDTKMVLDKHKMGKKHQMNLGKLKGKTVTGQTSKKKAVYPTEDDLQTKKRRVIEGGAAPHTLRTCTICNVVSISATDFYKHLAGQRHRDAAALISNGAGTSSYSQLRIRN
ncbi:putative transcription factor C2H2 family [Rosa chinensis]|uniref:Putative transcription factor C2H2 family n=1 Tax=Rosa chinensis TaxID=74649 RepID=A0A2P6QIW5_ROSCH|nr:uncharacterized protein LOC112165753 [Rosa chinensis]PRQ34118.1 putative transcription factor C2H2 family [Rosa chinensis]